MNKVFIKKHRTEDSSLQINISMLQVLSLKLQWQSLLFKYIAMYMCLLQER